MPGRFHYRNAYSLGKHLFILSVSVTGIGENQFRDANKPGKFSERLLNTNVVFPLPVAVCQNEPAGIKHSETRHTPPRRLIDKVQLLKGIETQCRPGHFLIIHILPHVLLIVIETDKNDLKIGPGRLGIPVKFSQCWSKFFAVGAPSSGKIQQEMINGLLGIKDMWNKFPVFELNEFFRQGFCDNHRAG